MKASQPKNMALGQLYTNEVDKRVLQAMAAVKREDFVPAHLRHCAYVDEDLDVGGGRFLIAPMVLGKLLTIAEITPASRVLVVGALSGYVAAVVAQLASPVFTTESNTELVATTRANMARMNLGESVTVEEVKNLADGYGAYAPFDAIIIPGAVEFVPEALGEQLSQHGRLVTIQKNSDRLGMHGNMGRGTVVTRLHNQLQQREYFDAASEILPSFEKRKVFVF